ncbi:elongation factor P [Haploplasma axanthum]|uniref:Elongation factor P n=1 Tax=Haploplasma axanthum TaxID=29552 RepID=A0A449BE15_HAPAX|nr:elongation factor P [Haploplasma axanthum]VEU80691.1 Elongation factor P [Haploplasma axanthum]
MISTNEFKTNVTIEFEGNIFQVIEFLHVKPGKGAAFVRTKLRNLRTGSVIDYTFNAGVKVKKAQINKVPMQYLYVDGTKHVFMNTETYEQLEVEGEQIESEIKFLPEGASTELIMFNESEILGINLPDNIVLKVVETVPGVKGDTKTNAMKDAKLETGIVVKVPLFIEEGERIVVSTYDSSYVSREK